MANYDIIGDIAVLKFKDETSKEKKQIAIELMNSMKNIKTILEKADKIKGRLRTYKTKFLAGKKTKETTHRENNCLFRLDVEKCYFSPRLANERLRIAKQVKFNETILVMFSGIAVYPIIISKNSTAKEVYSIEINPEAHKYALENLKLNKINNIKLFKGDVKKILPKIKLKFDRIIMPAPKNAEEYLSLIKRNLKKSTIIHFYDFSQEKEFPESTITKIKKVFKKIKVLKSIKCGAYSPYTYRVCIDFQVL